MVLIIAFLLAILILAGKGIGWLIGSAWDLLWFLVLVLVIVWIINAIRGRGTPAV